MELGNVLVQLKRPDEAATQFQQLIRQNPDFIPAYLSLAQLLMRGQPQEAVKWLEEASLRAPEKADVAGFLMIALAQTGQSGKALQIAQQALSRNPKSFELRFNFGLLLKAENRPVDAMNELRKAIQIRPGDQRCVELIRQLESQLLQKSR